MVTKELLCVCQSVQVVAKELLCGCLCSGCCYVVV